MNFVNYKNKTFELFYSLFGEYGLRRNCQGARCIVNESFRRVLSLYRFSVEGAILFASFAYTTLYKYKLFDIDSFINDKLSSDTINLTFHGGFLISNTLP